MSRTALSIAILLAATMPALAERSAQAEETGLTGAPKGYMLAQAEAEEAMPADYAPPGEPEQEGSAPPIPPYVDGPPVPASGGGYCFEGPHPVDSRVEPGVTWDGTAGRHMHGYPPFDLRLFSFQNGCYYFIGDPTDFGYAGDTYSYYGAHPVMAGYGGGWCFMIGAHRHFWRPWSPFFVTVGPWFYWEGPYDPFFWTYWPFYHYYYRSHYPTYYARGAFFRGHTVAPRITSVPRPMGRAGTAWHGAGHGGAYRAAPMAPRGGPAAGGAYRGAPTVPRGPAPGTGGGVAPRNYSAPAPGGGFAPRNYSPPASGGGFAPRSFSPPAARPSGGSFGGGHFGGGGHGRR
jgi:hypothetical protein